MRFSLKLSHQSVTKILLMCVVVLLSVSNAMSQAQSNAADLQGIVRDPSNAVVNNATVTVKNPETNFSRDMTTNEDGYYKIVNLPPGEYQRTITATGYKT